MTMPQLMNCPHQGDGRCNACLGEAMKEARAEALEFKKELIERIKRIRKAIEQECEQALIAKLTEMCERYKLVFDYYGEEGDDTPEPAEEADHLAYEIKSISGIFVNNCIAADSISNDPSEDWDGSVRQFHFENGFRPPDFYEHCREGVDGGEFPSADNPTLLHQQWLEEKAKKAK